MEQEDVEHKYLKYALIGLTMLYVLRFIAEYFY